MKYDFFLDFLFLRFNLLSSFINATVFLLHFQIVFYRKTSS